MAYLAPPIPLILLGLIFFNRALFVDPVPYFVIFMLLKNNRIIEVFMYAILISIVYNQEHFKKTVLKHYYLMVYGSFHT